MSHSDGLSAAALHVQKFLGGRRSFKNAQNWGSRERLSVLFTSLLGDVAHLFLLHPVSWGTLTTGYGVWQPFS